MSQEKTIRGTTVEADVVDLATEEDGLITAIVGFFDVHFPRAPDPEAQTLGGRARKRAVRRAETPIPLLRK
jgi:hypothetical protein